MLNLISLFTSYDGEVNGFHGPGTPSIFIRLAGCNVGCKWCDTKYANKPDIVQPHSVDQLIDAVVLSNTCTGVKKVTITGGEPLLQFDCCDLIRKLHARDYLITIETSGTIDLAPILLKVRTDRIGSRRIRFIVDYKLASAQAKRPPHTPSYALLNEDDYIKFVIASDYDYTQAIQILEENPQWKANIAFSPMLGKGSIVGAVCEARRLAEKLLQDMQTKPILAKVQYNLQLHKILWPMPESEEH